MKSWLRRTIAVLGIFAGLLVLLIAALLTYVEMSWDRPIDRTVPQMVAPTDPETMERGRHLYENTMLCWSCHGSQGSVSPSEPQSGGREFDATGIGPGFGYFYASNLTPDEETGIGSWSDGELVRAIREGVNQDGALIFPIMPYEWYHDLSDSDALALVAYMRSLTPVRNAVTESRWSLPARALLTFGVLRPGEPVTPPVVAPPAGPTIEYGGYLANQASGCADCHSPRDPSNGQYDRTRPFGGGLFPFPEEGFSTTGANLTPDGATGIGNWTEEQFTTFMRDGTRPDGSVALTFMPWPYYARWNDDDLRAVWLYLRSLEPVSHKTPPSELTGKARTGRGAERGEAIFGAYCLMCHGVNGAGTPLTDIALRDEVEEMDQETLRDIIKNGSLGSVVMPAFENTFSKDQIDDLLDYLRTLAR